MLKSLSILFSNVQHTSYHITVARLTTMTQRSQTGTAVFMYMQTLQNNKQCCELNLATYVYLTYKNYIFLHFLLHPVFGITQYDNLPKNDE